MKIVVADDSMVMRNIITKTVQSLGHTSIQAGDGREVLRILNQDPDEISLVLLDWHMPEMDGIEVLREIQKDERLKSIPVLVISTESEEGNVHQARSEGAANYLTKPFTPEDLEAKINETLAK